MKVYYSALVLLVLLFGLSSADETATSSSFTNIPWRASTAPFDFEATIEFCQSSSSSTVFGYRLSSSTVCGSLAPLMRMTAGKNYKLILKNTAPTLSSTETNLHTHGLHISGDGNADDITRFVQGGNCLQYNYTIPAGHADGTYWYHAHKHLRTQSQVSGGAFGLLIIDPTTSELSSRPTSVQQWIANERRLILSNAGTGRLANGKTSETIQLTSNEWHLLRVAAVDPSGTSRNIIIDNNVCEARFVAYDGVWRSQVPRLSTVSSFQLTGSSRADLAIQCSQSSGIWYDVQNTRGTPIVQLNVVGSGSSSPSPYAIESSTTQWIPTRPLYLENNLPSPGSNTYSISMSGAQINGQSWDASTAITSFSFGSLQQWSVTGSGAHPFHLHLYHMQVATSGGCGVMFEEGQYYDTLSSTTCIVRFRMADIGGRMVMHCHVLGHEDNGAMVWGNVMGGPPASSSNIAQYTC